VQHGWGSRGALVLELAPWYSYEATDAQLHALPPSVVHAQEVYDRDDKNDWRMAIDLFDHESATEKYFLVVHSASVNGCTLTADHSTPGRNTSLRQKQYGVFRPFDALADYAFTGSAAARDSVIAMTRPAGGAGYSPLSIEPNPLPMPGGKYEFPWTSRENPRAH
jgi:hypothetical protein